MTIFNPTPKKQGAPKKTIEAAGIGAMSHRVIGELLTAGHMDPTPEQVVRAVGALPLNTDGTYLLAARQQLQAAASIYFAFFAPPPDWKLIGVEVPAPRTRFDLLWETPQGVMADEIKTGRFLTGSEQRGIPAQVTRQLAAGTELYGDQFVGVRIICVGAPRLSRTVTPDGQSIDVLEAS